MVVVVAVVVVAVVFIIVLVVLVYVYHLNCDFPHTFHVILIENCAGVLRLVHLHTNGRRGWESKSLPRRPLLPCRMATSKSTLIADRLRQIFTLHNGNTYVNFMLSTLSSIFPPATRRRRATMSSLLASSTASTGSTGVCVACGGSRCAQ